MRRVGPAIRRGNTPTLTHQRPVPVSEDSKEDIGKQVQEAESERSKTFDSRIQQIEFDFLREEIARNEPELERDEAFQVAQNDRHYTFIAQEKLQAEHYEQAEGRRDEISRSNETRRDAIFDSAQSLRNKEFDKWVESSLDRTQGYLRIIERLFVQGRHQRNEMYGRITEAISTEFIAFLRVERPEMFVTAYARLKATSKTCDDSFATCTTGTTGVKSYPMHQIRSAPEQIRRTFETRKPEEHSSPQYEEADGESGKPEQPVTLPASAIQCAEHEDNGARTESLGAQRAITNYKERIFEVKQTSTINSTRVCKDASLFHAAIFQEMEEERNAIFRRVMETHETTFQGAESTRQHGSDSRESQFTEDLASMESRFVSYQKELWYRFHQMEEIRSGCARWRDDVFNAAETRYQARWNQCRTQCVSQISAALEAEQHMARSLKSQVINLLFVMNEIMRDGQEYPAEYGFVPKSADSISDPIIDENPFSREEIRDALAKCGFGFSNPKSDFASNSGHNEHGIKSLSVQESSFIHKTRNFDIAYELEDLQYKNIFVRAEERREQETAEASKRRQQIFDINESKRVLQFQEQQRSHSERWSKLERNHIIKSYEDQRKRASLFDEAEANRERTFRFDEDKRASLFDQAQTLKVSELAKELEAILVLAREQETERERDFAEWELSVRSEFAHHSERWKEKSSPDRKTGHAEGMSESKVDLRSVTSPTSTNKVVEVVE